MASFDSGHDELEFFDADVLVSTEPYCEATMIGSWTFIVVGFVDYVIHLESDDKSNTWRKIDHLLCDRYAAGFNIKFSVQSPGFTYKLIFLRTAWISL